MAKVYRCPKCGSKAFIRRDHVYFDVPLAAEDAQQAIDMNGDVGEYDWDDMVEDKIDPVRCAQCWAKAKIVEEAGA